MIEDAPRPVRHNMFVTVHAGASETVARVRLLDAQEAQPGESVWAQLKMEEPVAVVKDDYFVLRSNQATLGGGAILETHARRHRRMHAPVLDRLAVMEEGSDRVLLVKSIETSEPIEFRALVNLANLETAAAKSELERMAEEGEVVILGDSGVHPGALIFTAGGSESVARRARDFLRTYHREHPLQAGSVQGGAAQPPSHDAAGLRAGAAPAAVRRRRGGARHGSPTYRPCAAAVRRAS